ncbi:MAG: hydrogenase nickel incorporation protein HypB [Acidobacteriota bacterium]|nr:hydrogenase nickel incorporation protein HypB [Acidobacteriota bacterium]
MCVDCGCGRTGPVEIHGGHHSDESRVEEHLEHYHHLTDRDLKARVLAANDYLARHNREHFDAHSVLCLNLISAPGSGKTALLERWIQDLGESLPFSVIEGDLQTQNDAERIRRVGVEAIQVNTGQGCHLDARMIHRALHHLTLPEESLLVIENVGNLVCPADFFLGEHHKVAVIACTEGADKPAKYPGLIEKASVLLINKIDMLPHLEFDVDACEEHALEIHPGLPVFRVSARTGEGMSHFYTWLLDRSYPLKQKAARAGMAS